MIYLIETSEQEKIALFANKNQTVRCWINGVDPAELSFTKDDGVELFASCRGFKKSYTTAEGESVPAYTAAWLEVKKVKTQNLLSLPDSTAVEIWQGAEYTSYQLPDGTELLRENIPTNIGDLIAGNVAQFDDLSEAAKEKITVFYEQQGVLYDRNEWLNNAYSAYLASADQHSFNGYTLTQELQLTGFSERCLYFSTILSTPAAEASLPQEYTESRQGAVFDRTTGESLSVRDIFTCDEQTLADTLFSLSEITDPKLLDELNAAFDTKHVIFYPESLEVYFPQGSLPSQEHTFIISLEYKQGVADIMHEWAIPT